MGKHAVFYVSIAILLLSAFTVFYDDASSGTIGVSIGDSIVDMDVDTEDLDQVYLYIPLEDTVEERQAFRQAFHANISLDLY